MSDQDRTYGLRYVLEPGKYTKEELLKAESGGCDQLLLCSYLEGGDGSGSYMWASCNGHKGEPMVWGRMMHCWLMLTKKLAEEAPADCPNQKEILELVWEEFRRVIAQESKKRREREHEH